MAVLWMVLDGWCLPHLLSIWLVEQSLNSMGTATILWDCLFYTIWLQHTALLIILAPVLSVLLAGLMHPITAATAFLVFWLQTRFLFSLCLFFLYCTCLPQLLLSSNHHKVIICSWTADNALLFSDAWYYNLSIPFDFSYSQTTTRMLLAVQLWVMSWYFWAWH